MKFIAGWYFNNGVYRYVHYIGAFGSLIYQTQSEIERGSNKKHISAAGVSRWFNYAVYLGQFRREVFDQQLLKDTQSGQLRLL